MSRRIQLEKLAKEVYFAHVEAVQRAFLPLIEAKAPKFPSTWAKSQCSSLTLTLHFCLIAAFFKGFTIVDEANRTIEEFTVVDIFSGVEGKEHVWNLIKFASDEAWYSIDLSIEQYSVEEVNFPTLKPWKPVQGMRLKADESPNDVISTHPLLPKVKCTASDGQHFREYWSNLLKTVKT